MSDGVVSKLPFPGVSYGSSVTPFISVSVPGASAPPPHLMDAVGGFVFYDGSYRIHRLENGDTLTVLRDGTAQVLRVAPGAGGGYDVGGGGGAGDCDDDLNMEFFAVGDYPTVIGLAGNGALPGSPSANGGNTTFKGVTRLGGGAGGSYPSGSGVNGGCGGGAAGYSGGPRSPGLATGSGGRGGEVPLLVNDATGSGGGGKSGNGQDSILDVYGFAEGGLGLISSITGNAVTYSSGGRGSGDGWNDQRPVEPYSGNGGDASGVGAGIDGSTGVVYVRYLSNPQQIVPEQ